MKTAVEAQVRRGIFLQSALAQASADRVARLV
jgi:hypothetical protein